MNGAGGRWRWTGDVIAAHVEMLNRVGLIDGPASETLIEAIERVRESAPPAERQPVALVHAFDSRIETQAVAEIASVALVGRGVIDVAATVARMELRSRLLDLSGELDELRGALLDVADRHVVSVMPIVIDGAIAQPGTVAHWLGGLISPLARAQTGLASAFATVNQSPLGSGSHASSGLENDRIATTELLGFEAPVPSSFDAVAAVDHFAAAADAAGAVAAPLTRWLNELVTLIRTEPASLRLGERWRSGLADMPQFDAPAGIESLSARGERLAQRASTVRAAGMRAGYAPVSARLGGLLDETSEVFDGVQALVAEARLLIAEDLEFNRAYLANRAGRAFSTSSDLADFLMIEEQQDPRAARAIAALAISRARDQGLEASGITPELIDGAALLVIGHELKVEFEAISRYLAPRRFIERRTAAGAPSPSSIRTYILVERARLDSDIAWRSGVAGAIEGLASER